jgi:hypothetical protein
VTSAAELIRDLEGRGVRLIAEGDWLRWEAPPGRVSPADLAELRANKAEVMAALQAQTAIGAVALDPAETRSDWTAVDWRGRYDEIAGSLEFENSLERADAEDRAYVELLEEWLRVNPQAKRKHGAQAVFVAMGALRSVGIVPSAGRLRLPKGSARAEAGAPGV